jgi:large subunit ribosomal protein L19
MTKVISPVKTEERKNLDLRSGDTVRVHQKIKDGEKFRTQIFEGIVLARKHGAEAGATFTVRKVVDSIGVERIFPLYSPVIEKIEVTKRSKVRRAKLYFVRRKAVKEMKKRMKMEFISPVEEKEEVAA